MVSLSSNTKNLEPSPLLNYCHIEDQDRKGRIESPLLSRNQGLRVAGIEAHSTIQPPQFDGIQISQDGGLKTESITWRADNSKDGRIQCWALVP